MFITRYCLSILFVLFFVLTSDAIAARCTGEASFAIQLCACTVYNRIHQGGWSEGSVLSAYYARSITPSAASVETVRSVLAGETVCGDDYYLFSGRDVQWLGLNTNDAVTTVCRGKACVYGFGKEALK